MYKRSYARSKNIIKKNVTNVFYNEKQKLYIGTDRLGVSLGASEG